MFIHPVYTYALGLGFTLVGVIIVTMPMGTAIKNEVFKII
jgi:hypothetical protein